ncbi:MAG: hypothetical protein N5P05_000253 [Chroococcopsis gigantea SAG 12.99]|jgi:hypothetical protein|nr:hypothetical protein [Chlorogloea purpurea SAG 13.99]MDV2998647.1 hypothetical protein [Chroococcopsis gigantea SAG 12.99]
MKINFFKASLSLIPAMALASATPADAYQIFTAQDPNGSQTPLASFPLASAQRNAFLSNLQGVGTESFESFANFSQVPLNLTFPGSTGNITANLTGGDGIIYDSPGGGRFATSGSNFLEVDAGNNFQVSFNKEVAAFGFYGTDLGDFGGTLALKLVDGTTTTVNVPISSNQSGNEGSVLFYGIIADNASETFSSVEFLSTSGDNDIFGFDDFTIGDLGQVQPPNDSTPEPATTLGLASLALLGAATKYKKTK